MQRELRWRRPLVAGGLVVLLLCGPAPLEAQYLDPGAGSIIVQAIVAVVVGLAATVKLYWTRISAFMTRRPNRDAEP